VTPQHSTDIMVITELTCSHWPTTDDVELLASFARGCFMTFTVSVI